MRKVLLDMIEWEVPRNRRRNYPTSVEVERPEPTNSIGELVDFAVQKVRKDNGATFINFRYSIINEE